MFKVFGLNCNLNYKFKILTNLCGCRWRSLNKKALRETKKKYSVKIWSPQLYFIIVKTREFEQK